MKLITIAPFSACWCTIVGVFLGSLLLLLMAGSLMSKKAKNRIVTFIGFYLLLDTFVMMGYLSYYEAFSLDSSLPLSFCSIMQLIAACAAISKKPFFFEVCLFFGILGPLQAFVTPAMIYSGEEYLLLDFFLSHGLTIMVPLFMAICMGHTPRKGSIFKAITCLQLIVAMVFFVNVNLDSNYMYLLERPPVEHPLNSGPHAHNVVLWHIYFYLVAFAINGLFYIKQLLDKKTTGNIKY